MKPISLLAFSLALVALMLLGDTVPQPTTPAAATTRSPLDGPGVLHMKARHTWTTPQGEQKEVRDTQFWFDPITLDARYDQKSLSGDYYTIMRRKGLTYSTQYPRLNSLSTETYTDAAAPALHGVQDKVLYYKSALDRGELRGIGQEVVGGKLATVLREEADLEGIDVLRVSVDNASGLPLKEVAYRNGLLGGLEEAEEHFITYLLVERVDRGSLPSDLFSVPATERRTSQEYLTPASAATFDEFGIYWTGTTFDTVPLATIYRSEWANIDIPGRATAVQVIYAQPPSQDAQSVPDSVQIHQEPALDAVDNKHQGCGQGLGASAESEVVSVVGREVTLCDRGSEGVRAQLIIDGTFITVTAGDRQGALKAVELLRKLN
jgi:hypothetical protein